MNRRLFLRGAGASLAIPAMASLSPAQADTAPPMRLLYYYVPNGFDLASMIPVDTGPDYTLSPVLTPLAPVRDDVLVLTGIDNEPGNRQPGDANAGAHFQQTASLLTCTHIYRAPFGAARSIDQVAADAIGYVTPRRSLQLGMASNLSGTCGGASWPCQYLDAISWADATTPLAKRNDPVGLFQFLFGAGPGVSAEAFERRRARRLKVLDTVREDARDLEKKLGTYDRRKLDQYLTAVNETENGVMALQQAATCDPGEPPGAGGSYLDKLERMLDMMALAFQCDQTRIQSFMAYSGGASHSVAYDWVSVDGSPITETFHTVSHHGQAADKLAKIAAINAWEVSVFTGLVQRLAAIEEVDGSRLLDNCLAFFTSEVSDGDTHSASNMPILVAGNAQGRFRTGEHIAFTAPDNKLADLHIAMMEAFGVSLSTFGDDGTHALPGVLI